MASQHQLWDSRVPEPATKRSKLPPLSHRSNSVEVKHPSTHFNFDRSSSLTHPNKECRDKKPSRPEATTSLRSNGDKIIVNPESVEFKEDKKIDKAMGECSTCAYSKPSDELLSSGNCSHSFCFNCIKEKMDFDVENKEWKCPGDRCLKTINKGASLFRSLKHKKGKKIGIKKTKTGLEDIEEVASESIP